MTSGLMVALTPKHAHAEPCTDRNNLLGMPTAHGNPRPAANSPSTGRVSNRISSASFPRDRYGSREFTAALANAVHYDEVVNKECDAIFSWNDERDDRKPQNL
ncbi:hypothetical protein [Lacipirellula sp.]|uniref:hypothetical protein n=1 Tax=Lacipirellula sp. TaxID=2691419 RepID=UPI003D117480